MVYVLLDLFFIFFYFLYVIKVLLIAKVQCVYDCKLTAKKIIPKKKNQIETLTEIRKKDKELPCVRPQIQDHSNKVLASKFFNK